MSDQTLGRYQLAAGAEARDGAPLRARDSLLERWVDLVLVPASVAGDSARLDRLRQEVERAAAFVHPDTATVYGLEEGDGRLFVIEAPVTGSSLATLLAAGSLPRPQALEIALTLCDVLAEAREAGAVHGSLHPGDVVLGEDGGVTVRGFGLSHLRRAVAEESRQPSPAAAYQAPEVTSGRLPDHRADLFAFGCILQEAVGVEVDEESPPALADAAEDLRRAAERCLSLDPGQRPTSAGELRAPLEALQRELLREPEPRPEAEPETLLGRLPVPARWGLLAAALLLLALVAWAAWRGLGGAEPEARPRTAGGPAAPQVETTDLAVMPFTSPGDGRQRLLAAGFGREVTRLLSRGRRLSVLTADSAAIAVAGGLPARQAAARLGVENVLEASFVWQRDEELNRAEVTVRLSRVGDGEVLWSETLEAFFGEIAGLPGRVAVGAARRLGGGSMPGARRAPTTSPGAYEAYLEAVGRSAAGGPEGLRAAAAAFEEAALLDPRLLLAHVGRARLQVGLAASGSGEEALAAARLALSAARELDPDEPEVHRAAAEIELSAGAPVLARGELAAALERLPHDPGLLRAMAMIERRQGRWDEAIEALDAARRRAPLDLGLAAELVQTLAWKRRFEEAGEAADRVARLLPEAAEPSLWRADLSLRSRGALEEARAALEAVPEAARADRRWQERMLRLEVYEGSYGAALDRLSQLRLEEAEERVRRGWLRRYMGSETRAAREFERARDMLDDRLESAPTNPWLSSLLGQAYAGTGGGHLGARMGQRAVAQLPVTVDAVAGAELVERLAKIYVLAGDHEHALDELAFLLEVPSPLTTAVLELDPAWRPLREEPRFRELIDYYGP